MGRITKEQIENIVIDTGAVYLNYGETAEKLLAPCRGGNVFAVDAEIREIEVDGVKGKVKGLRRKIREDASLTVNIMDLSLENLQLALPGSVIVDKKLSNGWAITDDTYVDNVTLVGTDMKGRDKVITIFNGLVDEAFEASFVDDDETVIELKISGHYDPTDTDDKLWSIEDVTELGA